MAGLQLWGKILSFLTSGIVLQLPQKHGDTFVHYIILVDHAVANFKSVVSVLVRMYLWKEVGGSETLPVQG